MKNIFNKHIDIEKVLGTTAVIFGESYNIEVTYKKTSIPELFLHNKKILINLPVKYRRNGNIEVLKIALEKMYDEIARIEIENVMEETRIKLNGLAPENYIIKRIPHKLTKLLQDRTIIINPEVVKYNKDVLKYVVLYEFCHLKYKTNSKKFWDMIRNFMPYYEKYEYIREVA